jgi:multiple sugar transport system ATP-binding protein
MAELKLSNVRKSFGATEIIKGVDLAFNSGEFVVFVGPSGCGKSTLLRMIAGLEQVSSGAIEIDGVDVTNTDPSRRGIAMVFQSYALYPHMTVEENMGFGLEMAGIPKGERQQMVRRAAEILHLEPYLQRKPKALSGGQRQRVAIGRAIVRNPKIFLFDEPLSNLDAELRVRMRLEIAKLHATIGATMVYVTHDQVEAMTLASRIVVLRAGHVEQVGAPMELYANPDNLFVAGFIGSPKMNFVPATLLGRGANGSALVSIPSLGIAEMAIAPRNGAADLPAGILIGIRPEHFRTDNAAGTAIPVSLRCDVTEQLGNVSYLYSQRDGDDSLIAEWRRPDRPQPGSHVSLWIDPADCLLFDPIGPRL